MIVMFQVHISRSVHFTLFSTVFVIAIAIQKCSCAGSLVTIPPAVDGVLTSCGKTQLICSHDNVGAENTRWRVFHMDLSVVCSVTVDHMIPNPTDPYTCSEFSFENITELSAAMGYLNSIAMVNPLPLDLSGFQMECIAGSLSSSPSVGNVTLCVIDQLSRPMNVVFVLLPNNLTSVVLEWDSQATCSRDTVSYAVAIDGVAIPPENVTVLSSTCYVVSGLEANRMYTASVRTVVSTCMSDQSNITFEIGAETPTPIVDIQFFCANSSSVTTVALSWMFSSSAPSGVVYPPTEELNIIVLVSDSSGVVSNSVLPVSQYATVFHLIGNESYTITVEANHDITSSSTPKTFQLTTLIYTVDISKMLQSGGITVKLSQRCIEDPTTFMSTLSYGSCSSNLTYHETQAFNTSGIASFTLNIKNVIRDLCIQIVVTHPSQPNNPLSTFEHQLTLNSCSVASINSVASSSVSVEFSLAESSGEVPHGTVAIFKPLSVCGDRLVGAEHAICFNGIWSDLSQRTSSSPLSTSEAVVITFVLTMISTLVVGMISSSLISYCIMKRRASKHFADQLPKGSVYEEVSQPKVSEQMFEMGENVAYGPVRH